MNLVLAMLILQQSNLYGIDPAISFAVMEVESSGKPSVVGPMGEIGLFQLLPSSFPNHSRKDLFVPETNIKLGIEYLAHLKETCPYKDNDLYVVCFNTGIENARHIKLPKTFIYYKKIMKAKKRYQYDKLGRTYSSFL